MSILKGTFVEFRASTPSPPAKKHRRSESVKDKGKRKKKRRRRRRRKRREKSPKAKVSFPRFFPSFFLRNKNSSLLRPCSQAGPAWIANEVKFEPAFFVFSFLFFQVLWLFLDPTSVSPSLSLSPFIGGNLLVTTQFFLFFSFFLFLWRQISSPSSRK